MSYLHNLPFFQMLDRVNRDLSRAISVRSPVQFTQADLAWFRSPIKGGK